MDTTLPAVEVIIPHYRDPDRLRLCLDSLSKTRYPSMTVLVVDNGSGNPELQTMLSGFSGMRLLTLSANLGYAGGCNAGFSASSAPYLVFMNDDTRQDPSWLEQLVAAAQSNARIAALQPKILSLQAHAEGRNIFDHAGAAGGMLDLLGYPWCYGRTFSGVEEDRGQYDASRNIFWASGAAMLVRRSVFEEIGGFDDTFFMHMEEIDLCWRMQLAGYLVRSEPSSVVWHEGGASLAQGSARKIYFNHRNNLTMLVKNLGLPRLLMALCFRLLLEPAAAVFYLLKGAGGAAGAIAVMHASADFLVRLPGTVRSRCRVQPLRKVADRKLLAGMPFAVLLLRRRQFS